MTTTLEHRVDLRTLPHTERLVRAIVAAERLSAGEELLLVTEQRPVHILPLLGERGLHVEGWEVEGGYETLVRRREGDTARL